MRRPIASLAIITLGLTSATASAALKPIGTDDMRGAHPLNFDRDAEGETIPEGTVLSTEYAPYGIYFGGPGAETGAAFGSVRTVNGNAELDICDGQEVDVDLRAPALGVPSTTSAFGVYLTIPDALNRIVFYGPDGAEQGTLTGADALRLGDRLWWLGAASDVGIARVRLTSGPDCFETDDYQVMPVDTDRDGWSDLEDCAPGDATIHPGAEELPGDGIDQDCDLSDEPAGGCARVEAPGRGWDAAALLFLFTPVVAALRRRRG